MAAAAARLTAPGVGMDAGCVPGTTLRLMFQGLHQFQIKVLGIGFPCFAALKMLAACLQPCCASHSQKTEIPNSEGKYFTMHRCVMGGHAAVLAATLAPVCAVLSKIVSTCICS